ncbi:MarR family transcriptional regulator [Arthrobacter pityocampae]|uniref:MarR family transcriptional regulator n=1 Tax=Arthrobacter pityocampae TaxID=547334 RepID=A0A2S5J1M3_9MICC|nr:MarR family winged helix-turn-helix transcriptional regulator [Arthrobacter pityocampae]PPB50640.1 MarR family transcriptional regulator [Arthrobacter pityocampae]
MTDAPHPAVGSAVEPAGEASDGAAGVSHPTASVRQASETWESLFRAQVGIMQRIRQDPAFKDLPIREYDVLFNLSRCPTGWTRLNELNHYLLISQPSLSRMVDRLEARHLVRRRPAASDHRGVELALTEEGRALQRRIGAGHVQRIREVLAPVLDPGEMDQLKALTDKINARLGTTHEGSGPA